jgi:ribosome-associated protein
VIAAFIRRIEITSEKLATTCAELASNKKAEDIVILDLREISTFTDFFVICSATSEPHLKAIAGEIETRLKEDYKISAAAVDGFPASQWIVLDYLQVVVHVFHRDKREFYSLENLWGDAPQIDWEEATAGSSRR